MAYSSEVAGGDDILATQYNNLRKDVIITDISALDINYTGGKVSSIVDNGVTITFTYSGTKVVSWTDGTNTWTPTYTNGRITAIDKT